MSTKRYMDSVLFDCAMLYEMLDRLSAQREHLVESLFSYLLSQELWGVPANIAGVLCRVRF